MFSKWFTLFGSRRSEAPCHVRWTRMNSFFLFFQSPWSAMNIYLVCDTWYLASGTASDFGADTDFLDLRSPTVEFFLSFRKRWQALRACSFWPRRAITSKRYAWKLSLLGCQREWRWILTMMYLVILIVLWFVISSSSSVCSVPHPVLFPPVFFYKNKYRCKKKIPKVSYVPSIRKDK